MIVSSGAIVSVQGGADADYTNKTSGIKHGRIDLDGKIKIEGDWTNSATSGSVFINIDTDGEVAFQGTNAKSIAGNSTGFEKLTVNTVGGISLTASTTVNGILTLSSGLLNLGTKNLTLAAASTISGTPSSTNMIVASSTGELRKTFSSTGSFTFPVGDNTSTVEYSPITLNFTSGTFGASAYAGVKLTDAKHSSNSTTGSYLTRYWSLSQSNISSYTYDLTGTYLTADVEGTEIDMFSGYWNGSRWIKLATVNDLSNFVTGTLSTLSDITAGDQAMFCAAGITISRTLSNISCNGDNDGAISISLSDGYAPYTFSWTTVDGSGLNATAEDQTGLTAGTYNVTVTDANGCTQSDVYTLTEPNELTSSYIITNVSCNGGTNGIFNLSVSGGTAPYGYNWSSGYTGQDLTNVAAGTYSVTITDSKGCVAYNSATISEPDALTLSPSAVNVTCNGLSNGSASANVSGGTTPYTYQWNDASFQTTETATALLAGNYGITVEDDMGCIASSSISLSEPVALSLTSSTTNASCSTSDGTATSNVTGGTSPYDYEWSTGSNTYASVLTSNTVNSLSAATYTVTITDANGCSDDISITVNNDASPTASISVQTNVSCNGGSDGAATVLGSGGETPYDYEWSNSQTLATATGLSATTYTVTITDNNNCTASTSVTITQLAVLNANIGTSTVVTCNGLSTGTATVSVSGGTGAGTYSYLWDNGETTATATALNAGSHSVVVTDGNGCTDNASITITEPAVLSASGLATDALCNGNADGSISLTVTGGTLPNTFAWSNGAGTVEDPSGLAAGTYAVTVTDSKGCTANTSVEIFEPTLLVSSPTVTVATCNGLSDGSVNANASGGTTPYTYQWDDASFQTTAIATNLTADTYNVVVADAHGCTANASGTVTEPAAIVLTPSTTNSSCTTDDGTATVDVLGGISPYDYEWSTGTSVLNSVLTSNTEINLFSGTYNVTVTDANSCSEIKVITVSDATAPTASIVSSNVSCFGGSDGTATVSATGGTTPYTYEWSNGQLIADATGLSAITYSVTVTDDNNCAATTSVLITQPSVLNASIGSSTPVTCNGLSTGKATVSVSGGTGAGTYSYLWDNGETTAMAVALNAGLHSVLVTDGNGCTKNASITITEPAVLSASGLATDALCNGNANGSISLTVTGGTLPNTFAWSNGAGTVEDPTGLLAGTYAVTVTDSKACTANTSVVISEPTLLVSSPTANATTCNGLSNGSVNANVTGGTSPYLYQWDDASFQTTAIATNLNADTYNVVVTDAHGCTANASGAVTEPAAIVLTSSTTNSSCATADGTATVNVTGGTSPYDYVWSTGNNTMNSILTSNTESALFSGIYIVTVSDANSCTEIKSITVSNATGPTASIVSSTSVLCNGDSNGSATVTAIGGVTPYDYEWSNGQTSETATSLSAATYTVTVTDDNNCTSTTSVTISQPNILIATIISSTPVSCNGLSDGTATVSASGGIGSYTYYWDSGETTATAVALNAIQQTVDVTDANGCFYNASIVITEPAQLTASGIGTSTLCYGSADGYIDLTVSGGNSPYSFIWSNFDTDEDINGLAYGTYSVTITDNKSCITTTSVNVDQPTSLLLSLSGTDVLCYGFSTGAISSTVSGGTSPYTYLWNDGAATLNRNSITAGTYTITVTDDNSCEIFDNISISQPDELLLTKLATNVSCYNSQDGSIDLTVSGGVTPYNYLWSNGEVTQDINALQGNDYDVLVTDSNSCTSSIIVTITEPEEILLTTTISNTTCGNPNGTASVNVVSGGFFPYTYEWDDALSQSTQTATGLTAGIYNVTVTSSDACTATAQAILSNIPGASISITSVNPLCNDDCNGSASVNIVGGTSPYTIAWNTTASTSSITNLCAGSYSVNVIDANACSVSDTVELINPTVVSASLTSNDVSCYGACNGNALVIASGGTNTFTYSWSNGALSASNLNLCANEYYVTVKDGHNCQILDTVNISQPTELLVSVNIDNVTCNGLSNGNIDLTVSGGVTPYTYSWLSGESTSGLTNISADNYFVTVTDSLNCTVETEMIVSEPNALVATIVGSDISCYGLANGTANLTLTGGTLPYTYLWSNAETTQNIVGLIEGTYSVNVLDSNSCSVSTSVDIFEPDSLFASIVSSDVICFGDNNGSIDLSVSGGTLPYTYSWLTGETTADLTNLSGGIYSVEILDSNTCSTTLNITIDEPSAILLSSVVTNEVSGGDGSIDLTVSGGLSPYEFYWNNAETTEDISNLITGIYSVTITDTNSCTANASIVVNNASCTLSTDVLSVPTSCNGYADGQAAVIIIDGVSPFEYSWSNGDTTAAISDLLSASYQVTVNDFLGCSAIHTVFVDEPTNITVNETISDVVCYSGNTGEVSILISGGTSPYEVLWNTGDTTLVISNLVAGNYEATITDFNLCQSLVNYQVEESEQIIVNEVIANEVLGNDGSISLFVTGGTTPYSYVWNTGDLTSNLVGLTAGTYSITVTDSLACEVSESYVVNSANCDLLVDLTATHISCSGLVDGSVNSTISGGTIPYTYLWETGETTDSLINLSAGTYTLTVQDSIGCVIVESITVYEPEELAVSFDVNHVLCNGETNGNITATIIGGSSPYTCNWSNGDLDENNNGLSVGTYTLTVSDINLCQMVDSVIISQPEIISISSVVSDVLCNGNSTGGIDISVVGGISPYYFEWSNGATTEDLSHELAGIYELTVSDENACSVIFVDTISQPEVLSITSVVINEVSGSDGSIDITVEGGVLDYSYLWSNAEITEDIVGLVAGIYNVEVTDGNGCTLSQNIPVNSASCDLSAVLNSTNVSCNNGDNGSVSVILSGGTSPFTYSWDNGEITDDIDSLLAGNYEVTIIDANSCVVISSVEITEPEMLMVTLSQSPTDGSDNGTATATVVGGTLPYFYTWDDVLAQTTETAFGLSQGLYTVNVEDANGCAISDTITVHLVFAINNISNLVETSIYPNPVFDRLNVDIVSSISDKANIGVYDAIGKLIYVQDLDVRTGNNHIEINTSNFANGVYHINILSNTIKQTIKFVKVSD